MRVTAAQPVNGGESVVFTSGGTGSGVTITQHTQITLDGDDIVLVGVKGIGVTPPPTPSISVLSSDLITTIGQA